MRALMWLDVWLRICAGQGVHRGPVTATAVEASKLRPSIVSVILPTVVRVGCIESIIGSDAVAPRRWTVADADPWAPLWSVTIRATLYVPLDSRCEKSRV